VSFFFGLLMDVHQGWPSSEPWCTSISRPKKKDTPTPTRRGWCTDQNANVSASRSGSHGLRPSGSMLKASAASSVRTMNSGLAGSSS
jgi:hypothetical protein